MKINISKTFQRITLLFTTICLMFSSWGFRILDPESDNPFFSIFEYELDQAGFDIVQNWESNVLLEGRPTLAPLANYKVSFANKENEWIKAFSTFYANALIAIPAQQSIPGGKFMGEWEATPIENRVFISFTRDDLVKAEKIKKVLEAKGYQVFLYTESNREPFTDPKMVVYCMKTAGELLVLDTENSRYKDGVIAEAIAFAKYTYRPESEIIAENKNLEQQAKSLIDQMQVSEEFKKEITDNITHLFEENSSKTYTTEELTQELKDDYNLSLEDILKDVNINKKADYSSYVVNQGNLSAYAHNQKLHKEIDVLKNDQLLRSINFIKFFNFCPYYKVPIPICPICSKGYK